MIPDVSYCSSRRIMRFMTSATQRVVTRRPGAGNPGPRRTVGGRVGAHRQPPGRAEARGGRAAPHQRGPDRTGHSSAVLGEIVESVLEPLQLLLVVVGVLSAIFGELRDAIAIFSVIVLVSAVEAISEVRAKRALQALRDLSAPNALVRRAGVARAVPVGALVVGDVLLVEAGSVVAADARVVRGRRLGHRRVQADGRARGGREGTRAGGRRRAARRAVLGAARGHRRGGRRRRGRRRRGGRRDRDRAPRPARRTGQGAAHPPPGRDGRAGARSADRCGDGVRARAAYRGPSGPAPARDAARRADARVRHDPRGAADPRDGARRARRSAPGAAVASCCGDCAPPRPSAR